MGIWKVVVVVCLAVATAQAKPLALEAHEVGGLSISTPKGWTFTGDAAKGMAVAQQDPKRKDAAQLLVIVSANAGTTSEDHAPACTGPRRRGPGTPARPRSTRAACS